MRIAGRRRFSDRTFPALLIGIAFIALTAQATAAAAPVSEAASFYHQGRLDSAFTRLQALKSSGDMKRRDSLSLYQYLGMATARLGREPEAEGYFATLLGLDSLFQFPRNEDPLVLAAFNRARAQRAAPQAAAPAPSAAPSAPSKAPKETDASPTALPIPHGEDGGNGGPLVVAGLSLTEIGAADAMDPARPREAHGRPGPSNPPTIGLALGSMPFGTGWFVRNKFKHGLVLGFLQVGGLALSVYASNMQTMEAEDPFRIHDGEELNDIRRWQWVQRISLSTAVGAYIFSLIASAGD